MADGPILFRGIENGHEHVLWADAGALAEQVRDPSEQRCTNSWKNPLNFSLAEWQQTKRLDLDPREIKQILQSAWGRSDNLASFKNALEEHGYFLARGDRRGIVATDLQGKEVPSVGRWTRRHGFVRLEKAAFPGLTI